MGIPFKDLKPGKYYKGYHQPAPQGAKCFYLVLQTHGQASHGQPMMVELMYTMRKTLSKSWSGQAVVSGMPDEESLLKEEVRLKDLTAEGHTPPPQATMIAPPRPTAPATPTSLGTAGCPSGPKGTSGSPGLTSAADLAALAKAKRNAGKVVIPENARSPRCVKCGGTNRVVAMFTFNAFTCTACEPE